MTTVREFVERSYRIIDPSSPTVPLHGSDLSTGISILNVLLNSYAATGLLITIAKTETINLSVGQEDVVTGSPDFLPTPDITSGRLSNLENAWLELQGVNYPLIKISINKFESAWKYAPLQGLPRFVIVYQDVKTTTMKLYPKPSQFYQFFCRGKFQLPLLNSNDDMSLVPDYYHLYLMFALAREIAPFKGRMASWTPLLEQRYQAHLDNIINSTEVNLEITGYQTSMLNGAARARAGV